MHVSKHVVYVPGGAGGGGEGEGGGGLRVEKSQ
jgi:hypothetical protein